VKTKVLVRSGDIVRPTVGDIIRVKGSLSLPGVIAGEKDRPFDYHLFLLKDGITATIGFAITNKTGEDKGFWFKKSLISIKNYFLDNINQAVAGDSGGLLVGLIIGDKSGISDAVNNIFARVGLSHIIVLSGYNISVVAGILVAGLAFISTTVSWVAGFVGIIIFVLMTGASSTAMRAGLMAGVVILAKVLGRQFNFSRALFGAGILMILWNPLTLTELSFQLSFLATWSLVLVVPYFEDIVFKKWGRGSWQEILATTLGVQILVMPLLLYKIGMFSLVFIISNLLVLPLIPWIMFLGLVIGSVYGFLPFVLQPLVWFTSLILKFILLVAKLLGGLSWSAIAIPSFPIWLLIIIYIGIFIWLWNFWKNRKTE
jgi:competence protein ComEC